MRRRPQPWTRPEPPKPELGVDVGGAVTFDGLRALWVSTKGNNAALFEGLHPIVAVRENSRTKATELRLIVGPIANVEAATRLCADPFGIASLLPAGRLRGSAADRCRDGQAYAAETGEAWRRQRHDRRGCSSDSNQ